MATIRWSTYLCAGVVLLLAVAIPWWAMATDSPVATGWVPLTLALWGLALAVGIVCTAFSFTRSTGVAIILATVTGAMAFVLLYMGAFALADWD